MIVYPTNRLKLVTHRGGSLHGTSMIEVRLQGCDVQCETCSAPETWLVDKRKHAENLEDAMRCRDTWTDLTSVEIVEAIEELQDETECSSKWVKITGGEPTLYDLSWLILDLRCDGYKIALETSGYNVSALLCAVDCLIVTPMLGEKFAALKSVLSAADEIRAVISTNRELTLFVETLSECSHTSEIVLVPARSKVKADMQRSRSVCEHEARWRGWRVV